MNNAQVAKVIRFAMDCIEEAARDAGPLGAPSGVVFAAMQQHGMTLTVYQQILDMMVEAGKIRVDDHRILVA